MTLRLGWKAGTEQYSPGELLDYALAAEQAGFDSIDASDHFHPCSERGQACFVWSWLGAAAAQTKRALLGTGVTCPILRYHPSTIAQAAATIAVMAPDRFVLGFGTGEAWNENAATGRWPDSIASVSDRGRVRSFPIIHCGKGWGTGAAIVPRCR